jgi:hypothetical protein
MGCTRPCLTAAAVAAPSSVDLGCMCQAGQTAQRAGVLSDLLMKHSCRYEPTKCYKHQNRPMLLSVVAVLRPMAWSKASTL